jgi:hypothetical protein
LDILPSSFDEFPHMYSEDELKWLKGSEILHTIDAKKRLFRQDYNIICDLAEEYKKFSYKEYLEARITAASRLFKIEINGI